MQHPQRHWRPLGKGATALPLNLGNVENFVRKTSSCQKFLTKMQNLSMTKCHFGEKFMGKNSKFEHPVGNLWSCLWEFCQKSA